MIHIDGSFGEGGGQVLRTALSLSLVTGIPFRIFNIRSGRKRPGLQRQHLTAVAAACSIGNGETEGALTGSTELIFKPGIVRGGEYCFDIESAGSSTLVLQALLPPLMTINARSTITIKGGTHNPFAPTFNFIRDVFLPQLRKTGPGVSIILKKHGFYPAGGGEIQVKINPSQELRKIDLSRRGKIVKTCAEARISKLPGHIASRELETASSSLEIPKENQVIKEITDSPGPGNIFFISVISENITEMFTAFGEKGVRAETVARKAIKEVRRYVDSEAAVGNHLADQLLIPMAIAGGGRFTTMAPSLHTRTNIEIIKRFIDTNINIVQSGLHAYAVTIS